MATFGTTTAAGTTAGGLTQIAATLYPLSQPGTVTKLSVYAEINGNAVGAIYSDNAGVPNALLVANNVGTAMVGGQFNDITVGSTHLAAGNYWLAFMCDTNSMRAFIAGGVNQAAYNLSTTYGTAFPSTFPAVTNQNNDYVSYATYTPDPVGNSSTSGANYEAPRHIIVGNGMSRSEIAN